MQPLNGEVFEDDYRNLCADGACVDADDDIPIASDMMSERTHPEFSDNEASSVLYDIRESRSKNGASLNPWHSADSPLLTFDLHSPAPTFGDCNDYIGSLLSGSQICSTDFVTSNGQGDGEGREGSTPSNQDCFEVSMCSAIPALASNDIEAEDIMSILSGMCPAASNEEPTGQLNRILDSYMLSAGSRGASSSPADPGLSDGLNPGSAIFSMPSPHLAMTPCPTMLNSTMAPYLLTVEATTSDMLGPAEVRLPGSSQANAPVSAPAGPVMRTAVEHQHALLSLQVTPAAETPSVGGTMSRSRPSLGPRSAAAKRRHRMEKRQPVCGGGSGGGVHKKSRPPSLSAAEAVRGAVGGDAPQLSEEELQRRIRRVKNRESVEKCRNKQKMRMVALEKELNALRRENGTLLAVTKCVHGTYEVIASEVAAITGQRPTLSC
jgi:hypothetical protein